MEILLDMDGVLADFFGKALQTFNHRFHKDVTPEQYIRESSNWDISKFYGISDITFWETIEAEKGFWLEIKPIPWYRDLYVSLTAYGRVTIFTSPSRDPRCAREKLLWLKKYMGLYSDDVIMGSRKELSAGNGILIDDSGRNVERFRNAGGQAILVPSTWNTLDLTFDKVWEPIRDSLVPEAYEVSLFNDVE